MWSQAGLLMAERCRDIDNSVHGFAAPGCKGQEVDVSPCTSQWTAPATHTWSVANFASSSSTRESKDVTISVLGG